MKIGKCYFLKLKMDGRELEYEGKITRIDKDLITIVSRDGLDEYKLFRNKIIFSKEIENFEIPRKMLSIKTQKRTLRDSNWGF